MAAEQVKDYIAVLYDRLRALARSRMLGQRAGHTLDPTGLAHEAIMKLMKCDPNLINDEEHFMTLAVGAMRQILVDHARAKAAIKRGGGATPASLGDFDVDNSESLGRAVQLRMEPAHVLALNEALETLDRNDASTASIVKLRTFAGMDFDEIAALLGVSRRTVERRWRYAMAELRVKLSDDRDRND